MIATYRTGFAWVIFLVSLSSMAQDEWKEAGNVPTQQDKGDFYYEDKRPKLLFNPGFKWAANAKKNDCAEAYLRKHHGRFGLDSDLANLRLEKVRHSLMGTHFTYRQYVGDVLVDRAELIVTISPNNEITQVFNTTCPLEKSKTVAPFELGLEAAIEAASSVFQPTWLERDVVVEAVYETGESLQPVYRVTHALLGSLGTWVTRIHGSTGQVLGRENTTLYHSRGEGSPGLPKQGVVARKWAKKGLSGKRASGSARVFDPDPRTALARDDLQDESDASLFEEAYLSGVLADITQSDGLFHLQGPWVTISDFDPPATPPSTSKTGAWTARRGEDGFVDAMTYYHISRNQAYVQSLGFKGNNGIGQTSIAADTDGHLGDDFSSYDPLRNRLSFGRGCVDDAEDADMILHFYFQALLYDINPEWAGGDSGGIAQGMGDYWAASHSYGRPNGASYHPEWVFDWDGHGQGELCWEGRYLDRLHARYDRNTRYWADMYLDGYTSAELWSTPLFQAMVTLVDMGQAREEADQIVLQSLFGIGFAPTMPEMAQAVLNAAKQLFPEGPHYDVYRENFERHGLLIPPRIGSSGLPILYEGVGANGVPDPGEEVKFRFALSNLGGSTARNITVELVNANPEDQTIILNQTKVSYRNLDAGETAYGSTFEITTSPSGYCGMSSYLFLMVNYEGDDGIAYFNRLVAQIDWGLPRFSMRRDDAHVTIPDQNSEGITRVITIQNAPSLNTHHLVLRGSLYHPNPQDLVIGLTRPDGIHMEQWVQQTSESVDFQFGFSPYEVELEGDWVLQIRDLNLGDEGVLNYWSIDENLGVLCEPPTTIVRNYEAHFLFTEENVQWQSLLAIINPSNVGGNLLLSAYDQAGGLVQQLERRIAPFGLLKSRVSDLFNNPASIAYVHASADVFIRGQSDHSTPNGDRSFGLNAPSHGSTILNVPHVAEDSSFRTWGRIANLGETALDVDFFSGAGTHTPISVNPGASKEIEFNDLFGGTPEPGSGWGHFENQTNDFANLGGVEMFGSRDEFTTMAGLTLSDNSGQALIFPHIPQDSFSFWSGIVLINPHDKQVAVSVSAFDKEKLLEQVNFILPPGSKRVDVVASYFPNVDVTNTEWLLVQADEPISGYELVGSQNANGDMAGLQALNNAAYEHYAAILPETADEEWLGFAIVSPKNHYFNEMVTVYRDEQGYIVSSRWTYHYEYKGTLSLESFSKPVWALMQTSYPTVGFLLKSSWDGERISAFNTLTDFEKDINEIISQKN